MQQFIPDHNEYKSTTSSKAKQKEANQSQQAIYLHQVLQHQIIELLQLTQDENARLLALLILSCLETKPNQKEDLKLPGFEQAMELINLKQKKKPWHTYKRGRKRHGAYRKQIWCKTEPKNTYEPRIVPHFRYSEYRSFRRQPIFKIEKQQNRGQK